jgi:hypothetical protein
MVVLVSIQVVQPPSNIELKVRRFELILRSSSLVRRFCAWYRKRQMLDRMLLLNQYMPHAEEIVNPVNIIIVICYLLLIMML